MLIMFDWGTCQQVERSEDKLGGAWVFRGTRVPVRALFENLETGAMDNEFLEWFPGVDLAPKARNVTAWGSAPEKSLLRMKEH